jgi:hypothetical protein
MKEFEKWYNKEIRPYIHNPADKAVVKRGWKEALKNFQSIMENYEKDCKTPEDFKTLYFHLKQVLKNEVGE